MTLQYDNAASVFFGITVLIVYLLPATVFIVRRLWLMRSKDNDVTKQARSAAEAAKLRQLQAGDDSKRWTRAFTIFVAFTALMWLVLLVLLFTGTQTTQLASYDPYVVLGLEHSATEAEIKAAYRTLSRKHHPDRGGDPAKFMEVSKAHETLTDATARENWQKFGNPDGRQALEISVGLPEWLTKGLGKYALLVGYISVLAVAVPCLMWSCYRANRFMGAGGLHEATTQWIGVRMNPTLHAKVMPELLAGARELEKVTVSPLDAQEYNIVSTALKAEGKLPAMTAFDKSVLPRDLIAFNHVLVWAHMARKPLRSASLQDIQRQILKLTEPLMNMTAEAAVSFHFNPPKQMQDPKNPPNFTSVVRDALYCEQMITQAVTDTTPVMSLAVVLPDGAAAALTNKKLRPAAVPAINNLRDLLLLSKEDRNRTLDAVHVPVTPELTQVLDDLPALRVTTKVFTVDQPEVAENDIVTLSATVVHTNLRAEAAIPPVYAPHFPFQRTEEWAMLLIEDKSSRLIGFRKFRPKTGTETVDMQFRAPGRRGHYKYHVQLISTSYVGLDVDIEVDVDVVTAPEVKEEESKEDLAAERMADVTLESYMGGRIDESDTEGEDEDDAEDRAPEGKSAAAPTSGSAAPVKPAPGKGKPAAKKPAADADEDESFAGGNILMGAKKKKPAPAPAPAAAAPAPAPAAAT